MTTLTLASRPFLRKSIATLSALAAAPATGKAAALVHKRIHVAWAWNSVTLTACDGVRALTVKLFNDSVSSLCTAVFEVGTDPAPRKTETHTIALSDAGSVVLTGDAGTFDLGHVGKGDADYPIDETRTLFDDARAKREHGAAVLELNPEFFTDGLDIVTGFWGALPEAMQAKHPPRFNLHTSHKHAPMLLTSEYPSAPPFHLEYLLMPYRSP